MPKPPGYIDKVNSIVKFVENPCDAPWTVYAETAIPATGQVVLALVTFGMDDVIRGMARPPGRTGRTHKRRGKKGRIRVRGIPEIGEAIGSKVPGANFFKPMGSVGGVKHIWAIDGVIQRGLWYWLLFDIVVDFFYDWSSLLNKSEFCTAGFSHYLFANGTGGTALGILGWQAMLIPNIVYDRGAITWSTSTGTLPAGKFQVTINILFNNNWFDQATLLAIIGKNPLFTAAWGVSKPFLVPGFGKGQLTVSAEVIGPTQFTIGWRTNVGSATGTEATISIMQFGN